MLWLIGFYCCLHDLSLTGISVSIFIDFCVVFRWLLNDSAFLPPGLDPLDPLLLMAIGSWGLLKRHDIKSLRSATFGLRESSGSEIMAITIPLMLSWITMVWAFC